MNYIELDIVSHALETTSMHPDNTYAKDRIKSARLKLNGINPAVITACV